jgi:antitoxin (DNA-binding transcriptional repressor) of toxin-antitoxin stability system
MKRVGIREFKDRATTLIAEARPLVIEKHGKPVGFYVPLTAKDKTGPEVKASVERLDAVVADILARTGMSEDEFVAELTEGWERTGTQRRAAQEAEATDKALATRR